MGIFTWGDDVYSGDIFYAKTKYRKTVYEFEVTKGDEYIYIVINDNVKAPIGMQIAKDQIESALVRAASFFKPGVIVLRIRENSGYSNVTIKSSKNSHDFLVAYKILRENGIKIIY